MIWSAAKLISIYFIISTHDCIKDVTKWALELVIKILLLNAGHLQLYMYTLDSIITLEPWLNKDVTLRTSIRRNMHSSEHNNFLMVALIPDKDENLLLTSVWSPTSVSYPCVYPSPQFLSSLFLFSIFHFLCQHEALSGVLIACTEDKFDLFSVIIPLAPLDLTLGSITCTHTLKCTSIKEPNSRG